jgi:C4-type Zn-finger protein
MANISQRGNLQSKSCPLCGGVMKDVVTIAPIAGEPGLIAYECQNCRHVMSDLIYEPKQSRPLL